MKPILLDLPEEYETDRLTIRVMRPGDGALIQAAYVEAGDAIVRWVPFADPKLTVEDVEADARKWHARFLLREEFWFLVFLKGTGTLVGVTALHSGDWSIPRFEIGYLMRPRFEGQGYCSEAVKWITGFAFNTLGVNRLEISCDDRNEPSWRVAERAGFTLEGILRKHTRDEWDGSLVDDRVYAKLRTDG